MNKWSLAALLGVALAIVVGLTWRVTNGPSAPVSDTAAAPTCTITVQPRPEKWVVGQNTTVTLSWTSTDATSVYLWHMRGGEGNDVVDAAIRKGRSVSTNGSASETFIPPYPLSDGYDVFWVIAKGPNGIALCASDGQRQVRTLAPSLAITVSGLEVSVHYAHLPETVEFATYPDQTLSEWIVRTDPLGVGEGTVSFILPSKTPSGKYYLVAVDASKDAKPILTTDADGNQIPVAAWFTVVAPVTSYANTSGKYTDAQYGFSFLYPSGFSQVDLSILSNTRPGDVEFTRGSGSAEGIFWVRVLGGDGTDISTCIAPPAMTTWDNPNGYSISGIGTTTVNGTPFMSYSSSSSNENHVVTTFNTVNGGRCYTVTLAYRLGDSDMQTELMSMFNSLRFIGSVNQ